MPDRAQALGKERAQLESVTGRLDTVRDDIAGSLELLELAAGEGDVSAVQDVAQDAAQLETAVKNFEFQRMFPGQMDASNAFLDIQAGAGGTEAQDWAQMLLRMYLKWADGHAFKVEVMDESVGEVAGIKGASLRVVGDYAYGWLRTETGVHRLVRKSPFDSGNRRHTSFASVFVSPEVDDDISVELIHFVQAAPAVSTLIRPNQLYAYAICLAALW